MIEHTLAMLLFTTGMVVVVVEKSMIKKVMGLNIMVNGTHVFLASAGFSPSSLPPILSSASAVDTFAKMSVDPLPQALILTSIVIDVSITAVLLALFIRKVECGER